MNKNAIQRFAIYHALWKLRMNAAQQIGIENIRRGRQAKLEKEQAENEDAYRKGANIYPDFHLMMLIRLEA